jgi:energy-coupling factor transporter transmembrane protein EcfT
VVGDAHWLPHLKQIGPMSAGLAVEAADRPEPWLVRRIFPVLATVGMIVFGMAGTIWGPRYYGKSAWAVPDDLWATMVAAQRFLHLDLAGLYTQPTNLVSFPGTAVILVPVVAIVDVAGLPLRAGPQGPHPGEWLLIGPLQAVISAVALFAADALAERLGASRPKRFVLAAASAAALWNVCIRWGHPEDAVAVGLLMYAVLALSDARTSRAAWLAGAAVAVQPLVLLAFPVLAVAAGPRRLPGFVARTALPSVLLLAMAAAANWTATVHAITSQPNAPTVDHPTPWIYVAPHLSNGSVAAGPARALTIVVACGCGLAIWWRWRTARPTAEWSPEILQDVLWWAAVALALRSAFEPVMVSYYVWPPLAVALAAASRGWWRLVLTGAAATGLTFLAQIWWRNPWAWWTPMVTVLGLTLLFAYPRSARSPAAQVLPEPGEEFVADGAP